MQQAAQADAPASMKPMDRILDYWLSPTVDNLRDRVGHVTSQGKRTKVCLHEGSAQNIHVLHQTLQIKKLLKTIKYICNPIVFLFIQPNYIIAQLNILLLLN